MGTNSGMDDKKNWKKNIFSSWRKVMLKILGFQFSKIVTSENPKNFIENPIYKFLTTKSRKIPPKIDFLKKFILIFNDFFWVFENFEF